MHPQLATIADELAQASTRAAALVRDMNEAAFQARPEEDAWSVAECLTHLNLMDEAMLPRIDAALVEALMRGSDLDRRYRRDPVGFVLSWALEPTTRMKTKTAPQFVPAATGSRDEVLSRFVRLKTELQGRLEAASGLDLNRVRVRSPLNDRISYNLYAAFRVIAVHERRHLAQAERARAWVAGARGVSES